MFAAVFGITVLGLHAHLIRVEVDVSNGLPNFEVVGLPNAAVREARDRVRSAIRNSGFQFPLQRVTVNLAPADLRKEGSGLDLPIAIGILAATEQVNASALTHYVFAGELSLEGNLRPIPGVLTLAVYLAKNNTMIYCDMDNRYGASHLIVPQGNLAEARLIHNLVTHSAATLTQVVQGLENPTRFIDDIAASDSVPKPNEDADVDWSDIYGQNQAKRALEIAAGGGHNVILIGPPGSGKTLLAKAYSGILPHLSEQESIEVTQLYSICRLLDTGSALVKRRPFRNPHHTVTKAGMIGGGRDLRPGELSYANHGVLFLDELPEFGREVLECLRQPLEDGELTLTRQTGSITYPANVSVIASMNPCPCGYYGDRQKSCCCTPTQIQNYRGKISGPLLDRFDLHIEVPRLHYEELRMPKDPISSSVVRERVMTARKRQWVRLGPAKTNAGMSAKETKEYCRLTAEGEVFLARIYDRQHLSVRAHDRVLRVARTIADLDASPNIDLVHLAEAIQFRIMDKPLIF